MVIYSLTSYIGARSDSEADIKGIFNKEFPPAPMRILANRAARLLFHPEREGWVTPTAVTVTLSQQF